MHPGDAGGAELDADAFTSARQSGEFMRKAEEFVRTLGIRAQGDGDNEISILLPNGSRIVGLPGREATAPGFSNVSLMLIDEAARTPAARDGDLWLIFFR